MPSSGWLAIGATLAALGVPALAAGREVVALVAVAALTCLIVGSRGRPRTPRFLVPIAVGALLLAGRMALAPPDAGDPAPPVGDGPWSMLVEAVGSPRDGRQVATLSILSGRPDLPVTRLAASLPRYPPIEPGDVVTVEGRTRERPDSPYGRYLERSGAWGTLLADRMEVVPGPDGPARLERWRRAAGEALTRVLPEPEAGLAAGILIGLRDRVDRDVAAAFTTAGVSHVVAISGWNIAIVAAAIGAVAGRLGRRRRAVVTGLAVVGYIAFAGASPSVLRAGAMAGVVLLARESGRSGRAAAALGWAAVLLLIADPGLVSDAGFQLSTLATAGLIAWATPTAERLHRLTRGHLPGWLTESLGVSLAAQLATLPIVLASFGRIALIAPGINLLVVPLVAPAMAAGIVAMAGGLLLGLGAPSALGAALAVPAWVSLRLMISIVDAAAAVPFASVEVEPSVGTLLALSLAATIVAVARQRAGHPPGRGRQAASAGGAVAPRPRTSARVPPGAPTRVRRIATIAVVAALVCTGAIAATRPPGVARLSVLDVGQGDAILLEGSRGGRLLVDGGPDPDRLLVELDRRLPPWDRRIDVVILSHPHEDHVAGLALLLRRYRVGRVLEPGMRGPGPGYSAWLTALAGDGATTRGLIAAGDRLQVDDVGLEARWPIRGTVPADPPDSGTGINNVSVVLLGTVGERRFLLTGDVEKDVDPSLLAAGLPRVDVLKVAHHGSRTATTDAFLAAVQPRVAIASAGADNPYGHPARATVDRLIATGARVYRTDVDGSVTVMFDPTGPVVRREPRPGVADRAVPVPVVARPTGPTRTVGYHRSDDGPLPDRGRCPAALPGSPDLVPRARARRGRGRGVPGGPDRGPWDRAGSPRRGGCGPAPRRGQAAPRRRSGPGPPPWRRVSGMADATGPSGTGASGRGPPRDPARQRPRASSLGFLRNPRGADRRLRRQARRPAPGVDGGPLRLVATAVPRWLGREHLGRCGGARGPAGGRCLPRGGRRAGGGPSPGLDRTCPGRGARPRHRTWHMSTAILHVWGDDDLLAKRAVARFAAALAAEHGAPLERWDVKVDQANATSVAGQLHERLATSVLFGGGTLAVVADPGHLVRRNETRDRLVQAMTLMGPGNAVVLVEATRTGDKPPKGRLADAVAAAGGRVLQAMAPRPTALGAWIEAEARDRGLSLAPGAAREIAERLGSRVTEGDVDRRFLSGVASMELDKLALRHVDDGKPVSVEDVRALVAEAAPASVWALTDAFSQRDPGAALVALDRLIDTTPEPVLLTVLHRRVVELLELGDRLARGAALPAAARAMGINSEFRAGKLATQARNWSTAELSAALSGLLELDAMVKGVPGSEADTAQRRLAITLWVRKHAAPRGGDGGRPARPG